MSSKNVTHQATGQNCSCKNDTSDKNIKTFNVFLSINFQTSIHKIKQSYNLRTCSRQASVHLSFYNYSGNKIFNLKLPLRSNRFVYAQKQNIQNLAS